ncbi:helix-turn-helix transcriptional regulator [bacterium]|nr:helix-turn-helix transcriptional regulator [bacterium]
MDKNAFVKLGYKIKYLRAQKGVSQLDLSLKTGLTTRTISRIECGIIDPKYSTLVKISEALGVELTELLVFTL